MMPRKKKKGFHRSKKTSQVQRPFLNGVPKRKQWSEKQMLDAWSLH